MTEKSLELNKFSFLNATPDHVNKEDFFQMMDMKQPIKPHFVEEYEENIKKNLEIQKKKLKKLSLKKELLDLTCLLYTSPSPRDLSTSRMPSSA